MHHKTFIGLAASLGLDEEDSRKEDDASCRLSWITTDPCRPFPIWPRCWMQASEFSFTTATEISALALRGAK